MRNAILLSVMLLSACATSPTDADQAHRESAAVPQPAAPQKSAPVEAQKPAPVEAQKPAPSGQVDTPPKKPKHNVEED